MFREYTAYLRDEGRTPFGVVHMVVNDTGEVYAGCSKVHPNDKFDRSFGRAIARNRALFLQDGLQRKVDDPKSWRAADRVMRHPNLFLHTERDRRGIRETIAFAVQHFMDAGEHHAG